MCLDAEMHVIVLSLLFMHYVSHLYLRVLFLDQHAFIRVVYLPLLDYVILLDAVFGTVVLHIHPKFILIPKHFGYLDLVLGLF